MTIKELLNKKIFYYVVFVFASVLVLFNLVIFIISSVQYKQETSRKQESLVSMIAHLSAQEDETVLTAYLEHYVHNHQVEIVYINNLEQIIYANIEVHVNEQYQSVYYDDLYVGEVYTNYQASYLSQEYSVGFILINIFSILLFGIGTLLFSKYLRKQNQAILTDLSHVIHEDQDFYFEELGEVNKLLIDAIHREKKHQQVYQDYIKTLAHDLKTPLTALSIYLEALTQKKLILDDSVGKEIADEIKSIENLIPKMIEMDIDQLQYRHDVSPMILKQLTHYKDIFSSKSIKLDMDLEPLSIDISDDEIKRIVENLVFNAFYYSEEGKTIFVKTSTSKKEFIVKDNGIGMDEQTIKHIFKGVYRGENANKYHAKGSGIGLNIVNDIITKNHGHIEIESKLNEGTIIKVMFTR
jgi:signal transduction histidine kinase